MKPCYFFFSALHFSLGAELVPVTVPLIFVADVSLPEKTAVTVVKLCTVTLNVTSVPLMVPVTSADRAGRGMFR